MKYNFDKMVSRKGTNSYKWDYNEKYFGRADVLPLWVADMDFECSEPIRQALKERLDHPVLGYTARSDDYISSVKNWITSRYGWQVEREWLTFCPPGIIAAMNELIRMFSDEGDEIIIQTPAYTALSDLVTRNKRTLVKNPLTLTGNKYQFDFEDLKARITPKTKILILCSPHNPTTRVWTRAELLTLAKIADEHNILVISDEIHCDVTYKGHAHTSFGSLCENSITCISASKTFNTSGLPQSTLIIPNKAIRDRFTEYLDIAQLNLDAIFSDVAAVAGYGHSQDWLDQMIAYVEGNFQYLKGFIEGHMPKIKVIESEGTYLAWLDFREFNLTNKEISERLTHKAGVTLMDGEAFGDGGTGFFRLNLACRRTVLEEALNRIEKIFK